MMMKTMRHLSSEASNKTDKFSQLTRNKEKRGDFSRKLKKRKKTMILFKKMQMTYFMKIRQPPQSLPQLALILLTMDCNRLYRVLDQRDLYLINKYKLLIKRLRFSTIRAKSHQETTKIALVILTITLRIGRLQEVELQIYLN